MGTNILGVPYFRAPFWFNQEVLHETLIHGYHRPGKNLGLENHKRRGSGPSGAGLKVLTAPSGLYLVEIGAAVGVQKYDLENVPRRNVHTPTWLAQAEVPT